MTEERSYPLDIRGEMSPDLSRWLWLIKWLLIIPHLIVLLVLSIVSVILTIVAFFVILFTGKYPRGMFNFNVNVLRWKWRVLFYSYLALGTDRYPPFSLASDDDYPADLSVQYPERLSRVKVIFKWWLLAIPHYIIMMLFVGMQALLENAIQTLLLGIDVLRFGDSANEEVAKHGIALITIGASSLPFAAIAAVGLMGALVLIAAVTLLFRGRYPTDIFDLVMGMQRWSYRVAGYSGLLYDDYPPFRLKP